MSDAKKATKNDWLNINDDGSATITLSRPLEVNGARLATLTMREPTVDDQLVTSDMKGSEAVKEVSFFANLCEVEPAAIRRLPIRDYVRLQAAYAGF
ncbi:phage tail assembly protein, partial [Escherichia coli]|uniref:phage tail assembly protein n=2 Tax=Enterobacterales TaxID=91347 RepID=UPI0028DD8F24